MKPVLRVSFILSLLARLSPKDAGGEASSGSPEEPSRVTFARDDVLQYKASAQKREEVLEWDLGKRLRITPGFAAPRRIKPAGLDGTSVAHAVMAAASIACPWAPCPAVHAVTAVAPRGGAIESSLLAQFAEHGRIEADTHQEPLAGSLVSLASVTPGGDGDGLRLYSGVLVSADECASETSSGTTAASLARPAAPHRSTSRRTPLPRASSSGWSAPCRPCRARASRRPGCRPLSGARQRPGGRGSGKGPVGGLVTFYQTNLLSPFRHHRQAGYLTRTSPKE